MPGQDLCCWVPVGARVIGVHNLPCLSWQCALAFVRLGDHTVEGRATYHAKLLGGHYHDCTNELGLHGSWVWVRG